MPSRTRAQVFTLKLEPKCVWNLLVSGNNGMDVREEGAVRRLPRLSRNVLFTPSSLQPGQIHFGKGLHTRLHIAETTPPTRTHITEYIQIRALEQTVV